MDYAIFLHILNCLHKLSNDLSDSCLWELIVSLLQVVIEVLPLDVLQDDEVIVLVLESVYHPDNVRVLAHPKDINLAPLLVDLDHFHVSFSCSLNGNLLPSEEIGAHEDLPKLPLAESVTVESEKVGDLSGTDSLSNGISPPLLLSLSPEVQYS